MAAAIGVPGSAQAKDNVGTAEMEVTLDAGGGWLTIVLVSDIGWTEGADIFIVPVRIVLEQVEGTQDCHATVEAKVVMKHGGEYMVIPTGELPGEGAVVKLFIKPGELPTVAIDGDTMLIGPVQVELPDDGSIGNIIPVEINKLRPQNGDPV